MKRIIQPIYYLSNTRTPNIIVPSKKKKLHLLRTLVGNPELQVSLSYTVSLYKFFTSFFLENQEKLTEHIYYFFCVQRPNTRCSVRSLLRDWDRDRERTREFISLEVGQLLVVRSEG